MITPVFASKMSLMNSRSSSVAGAGINFGTSEKDLYDRVFATNSWGDNSREKAIEELGEKKTSEAIRYLEQLKRKAHRGYLPEIERALNKARSSAW